MTHNKLLNRIGWGAFAIFCLLLFTFFKLPEDKLKTYINGSISAALAERGMSFSTKESSLSYLFGIRYRMKGVTLFPPAPAQRINLEELDVSPSVLALLVGKYKANIRIKDTKGQLDATVAIKNTQVSVSFDSSEFDIGKLGLLNIAAGLQTSSAILDGTGSFSTDTADYATTDGNLTLQIRKFVLDAQSIYGFSLPKISISETMADLTADNGKVTIKTLKFGKQGNAEDDLQGNVTGTVLLGKRWDMSKIELKTKFSFSPSILKSFVLLEAILGSGKQSDGSYAFNLTGPLLSPIPTPVQSGK